MSRWVALVFVYAFCVYEGADSQTLVTPVSHSLQIVENRGQVRDQRGNAREDVLFLAEERMLNVQFRKDGISYDLFSHASAGNTNGDTSDGFQCRRIDINFTGCLAGITVEKGEPSKDYVNYYLGNGREIRNVYSYDRIIYRNVYPGIDIVFYSTGDEAGGAGPMLKFDILIRPGGKIEDVKFDVAGTDELFLDAQGRLFYRAGEHTLSESIPVAYLRREDGTGGTIEHPCRYRLSGSQIRFTSGPIPEGYILVVDPLLVWGTYYGGGNSDRAYEISWVDAQNFVFCGRTESTSGIATAGAFQNFFAGVHDGYVAKFDINGNRVWATYFGSSAKEASHSIFADPGGDIYLAGETESSTGLATAGVAQTVSGGGRDAFLAKFDASGYRTWCTYLGGSGSEEAFGVLSSGGSVYLTGRTESTNFPVTPGAFQNTLGGGDDCFIAALTPSGSLTWATYFGGSYTDRGLTIAAATNGNVLVAGETGSTGMATAGAAQTIFGGNMDGLLSEWTASGSRVWSTYYGGNGVEVIRDIAVGGVNQIAVIGGTESTTGIATNGTHQTAKAGGQDAMLAMFDNTGGIVWGTYFGGSSTDQGYGICIGNNQIFITGETYSSNGIADPGSHQPAISGASDMFFADFDLLGHKICGSYYGGSGSEIGYDVVSVGQSELILVGETVSSNGISTAGSHQPALAGSLDAVIARLLSACSARLMVNYPPGRICPGDTMQLGGSVTGGMPPYHYHWTPATGLSSTTIASPLAFPTSTTVYIVEVTDSVNNVCYDTVLVVVGVNPVAEAGPAVRVCPGASGYLNGFAAGGQPPYTYIWIPADGLVDPASPVTEIFAPKPIKYTLRVTDAFGCIGVDSVFVSISDSVLVDAGPDLKVCANGSLRLTGSVLKGIPPYTYRWLPPQYLSDPQSPAPVVTPVVTTRYYFEVTDSMGCKGLDSVLVEVGNDMAINAGPDMKTCHGERISLEGIVTHGRPPYSFVWTPGIGLSDPHSARTYAKPASSVMYTLCVTDSAGCSACDSVYVTVGNLNVDTGPDRIVCSKGSVAVNAVVQGGSAPYTCLWNPAAGVSNPNSLTPTIFPSQSGLYILTVIDVNGCTGTDTLLLTMSDELIVEAGNDTSVCPGANVPLLGNVKGGTPQYQYRWEPSGLVDDPSNLNTTATPGRTGYFYLTVTDINGCIARDSVLIRAFEQPRLDAGPDQSICKGRSVLIGNNPQSGTPPFTISWSPSAGLSNPTAATPLASPASTTTYTVTVTDVNGCRGTDTVTVFVAKELFASAGPDKLICNNGTTKLEGSANGGIPPYTYLWSPSTGLSSTKIAQPEANLVSSSTYVLTVTDSLGCTDSDTVTVLVSNNLHVDAGDDAHICSGAGARLHVGYSGGTAPFTILWSPATGLSSATTSDITATPSQTTTYIVCVSDVAGCTGCDTITVHVNEQIIYDAGPDASICLHDSVAIGSPATWGTAPYTYHWTPANGVSNPDTIPATVVPTTTASYIVTATDNNGCVASDTIQVFVFDPPVADAGGAIVICAGDTTQLVVQVTGGTGPYTFSWTPPESLSNPSISNPLAFPKVRTEYVAIVTDANGCSSSDTVTVIAADPPLVLISPAGDTTICEGDSIVLRADGNSEHYLWSTGDTSSTIVVRQSGVYTVKGISASGCWSMSEAVRVTVVAAPAVLIQGPVQLCSRDSIVYSAIPAGLGGYTWTISGGSIIHGVGTDQIIVTWASGTTSGIIEVVAGSAPCTGRDTLLIELNDGLRPAIQWDGDLHLCVGETLVLTASSGYRSYRWSNGDTGASISVNQPGVYYLWAEDSSGCGGYSDSLTVTVSPYPPVGISGNTILCGEDSTTIEASQGYSTYQWSTGDASRTITVTEPGLYTVYAVDSSGCSSSADMTVVKGSAPETKIVGDTVLCSGGAGSLSTDVACWSYLWSTGDTSRTIQVTQQGLYWVTVRDDVGCTSADSVYVFDSPVTELLVEASDIHADPGETVFLTIRIVGNVNALVTANAAYSGTICFQRSVLTPVNAPYTDSGDLRYVPFNGVYNGAGGILARIECLATLGQTDTSSIQIQQFTFGIPCPEIRIDPGMVEIRICREGGKRLVGTNRQVSVSVAPNPFELTTRITYRLPYESHVLLLIKDALGREVVVLADGTQSPGNHLAEFQADRLPSGIYYYVLQTDREQITGKMWRVK